jgi:hypothetical protein
MSIATVGLVGAKSNGVMPLLSSFYKILFMKQRALLVSATETKVGVII